MKKPLVSTSDLYMPKDMCACTQILFRRASKMAQCVKAPSSELGDLSLTPTTHRVEESQSDIMVVM